MKKFFYMAVAAIAALSSCSSDNDPIVGETGKQALTFTASMESDVTRATYNSTNHCAQWEVGDQISINGKTYNAQSAGLTTTFTAAGQEAEGSTYNAYFACTYDGTTATLPAEVSETWADGKFNMPMYATSTTTDLEFKNLCGVLKITVKSTQIAAVKKIKVSSATKAVSGAFTVTSDAAVLTSPSTVANTLTVTYTDAVSTTAEGKVFYVAVPAQTYQELKIELDADGSGFTKSMTTKSATNITVARSKIYPITFADNATPTGPEYVEIGGKKWATMNLGATTVAGSLATCAGDYYQWGSVNTLYESISWDDTSATFSWKSGKERGFVDANKEYTDNADLPDANDVVKQKIGNGWRMPTKADFQALHEACTGNTSATSNPPALSSSNPVAGVYWLEAGQEILSEYTGVAGILYVARADTSKRVFFPAAGFGKDENRNISSNFYWSSSLNYRNAYAHRMNVSRSNVDPSNATARYFGLPVRPVKD